MFWLLSAVSLPASVVAQNQLRRSGPLTANMLPNGSGCRCNYVPHHSNACQSALTESSSQEASDSQLTLSLDPCVDQVAKRVRRCSQNFAEA